MPAPAACLIYNDVLLNYLTVQELTVEPESDPTHTDQTLTKYTLHVRGMLAGMLNNLGVITPGASWAQIQHMLTTVRRPMTYTAPDGEPLFDITGPDPKNGPFPGPA